MNPIKFRDGREAKIQDDIITFLTLREWFCKSTHGNAFQSGFPDVYATNAIYGMRWIEVKCPDQYCFTPAQIKDFTKLSAYGTGIWILSAATEYEYKKLFGPPNWHIYLANLNPRSR